MYVCKYIYIYIQYTCIIYMALVVGSWKWPTTCRSRPRIHCRHSTLVTKKTGLLSLMQVCAWECFSVCVIDWDPKDCKFVTTASLCVRGRQCVCECVYADECARRYVWAWVSACACVCVRAWLDLKWPGKEKSINIHHSVTKPDVGELKRSQA